MLLEDRDERVRWIAAHRLGDREHLQEAVARGGDTQMRIALASTFAWVDDRSLPEATQRILAADESREAREWVAQTTNLLSVFEVLMRDEDPRVRGRCAANPRITREQIERLISDSAWQTRSLAVQLGLRYPDDEQLIRLATDRSSSVRWFVIFRVDAPREAVELVARDADELNRHHAERLLGGGALHSPQACKTVREGRTRAERGLAFLPS